MVSLVFMVYFVVTIVLVHIILQMKIHLNDKIWERYSLLNLLYKKVHDCKVIKIKMAAPRQTLKNLEDHFQLKNLGDIIKQMRKLIN